MLVIVCLHWALILENLMFQGDLMVNLRESFRLLLSIWILVWVQKCFEMVVYVLLLNMFWQLTMHNFKGNYEI